MVAAAVEKDEFSCKLLTEVCLLYKLFRGVASDAEIKQIDPELGLALDARAVSADVFDFEAPVRASTNATLPALRQLFSSPASITASVGGVWQCEHA